MRTFFLGKARNAFYFFMVTAWKTIILLDIIKKIKLNNTKLR